MSNLTIILISGILFGANILLLKKKYLIKELHDIIWLSLIIGMGQLALIFWLNFVPLGSHLEEYKIIGTEETGGFGFTTIYLENDAYSNYSSLRSFEGNNVPRGDTIVYKFNEGLIGFKIYDGHSAH